ncbi:hypothetical protein BBP40_009569 [Aspergillus hancockii]|nr:hypothetical protein BBP40_009569 [Aspergillus hancockii]
MPRRGLSYRRTAGSQLPAAPTRSNVSVALDQRFSEGARGSSFFGTHRREEPKAHTPGPDVLREDDLQFDAFDLELLAQSDESTRPRQSVFSATDNHLHRREVPENGAPKLVSRYFFECFHTTPHQSLASSSCDVDIKSPSSPLVSLQVERAQRLEEQSCDTGKRRQAHQTELQQFDEPPLRSRHEASIATPLDHRTPFQDIPMSIRGIVLVSVHELPDKYRSLFHFPVFNAVQSKCYQPVYKRDDNIVLATPTGSVKTVVMELAICRLLNNLEDEQFKVIYQAPTKSLCSERFRDWNRKFHSLSLQCAELTGDTDYTQLRSYDSKVEGPCTFDAVSEALPDEVHILKESRGATLEAVVSRMETIGSNVRFVALSATIPNSEDIATWMGKDATNQHIPAHREHFGEEFRPVKLQRFVYGYQSQGNDFALDKLCSSNSLRLLKLKSSMMSASRQSELGVVEFPDGEQYQKHEFPFQQDKGYVFSHINRLIRCIIDCQICLEDSIAVRNALELSRSFGAKVWGDSPFQMKQIEQVAVVAVRKFAAPGIASIEALELTKPHQIDIILSKNPPFGLKLLDRLSDFPKIRVSTKLVKMETKPGIPVRVYFKADVAFKNEKCPTYFQKRPVHVCFLAETSDELVIGFRRMSASKIQSSQEIKLSVEIQRQDQYITCYVMCDDIDFAIFIDDLVECIKEKFTKVTEFHIQGNELTVDSLPKLGEIIALSTGDLRELDISNNAISVNTEHKSTWDKFLNSFKNCYMLKKLDLGGNPIGSVGIENLARVYIKSDLDFLEDDADAIIKSKKDEETLIEETASLKIMTGKENERSMRGRRPAKPLSKGKKASRQTSGNHKPTPVKGTTQDDLKHFACTRGLRSIAYLILSNVSMTKSGTIHLASMLSMQRTPAQLLKFLPSGKSLILPETANCKSIIWVPNDNLPPIATELLEKAQAINEIKVHIESDDETSNETQGLAGPTSQTNTAPVHKIDTATQRELQNEQTTKYTRLTKRVRMEALQEEGVYNTDLWIATLRMMNISRILLWDGKDDNNTVPAPEKEQDQHETEDIDKPEPDTISTEDIAHPEAPGPPRTPEPPVDIQVIEPESEPEPVLMGPFHPGADAFETNFPVLHSSLTTRIESAVAKEAEEAAKNDPSPSPSPARSGKGNVRTTAGLRGPRKEKETWRFGFTFEVWRMIIADAVGADGILDLEQQIQIMRYATNRKTLEDEMNITGLEDHQQIWRILEKNNCFTYSPL